MVEWVSHATDMLWRNALGTLPLVIVAAAVCRWLPCRPSTRHSLWLIVLLCFVTPSVLPTSELLSDAMIEAAIGRLSVADAPCEQSAASAAAAADEAPLPCAAIELPAQDVTPLVLATSNGEVEPPRTSTPSVIRPKRARTGARMWEMLAQTSRSAGPAQGESKSPSVGDHITNGGTGGSLFAMNGRDQDQIESSLEPWQAPAVAEHQVENYGTFIKGDEHKSAPQRRVENPRELKFAARGIPAVRAFSESMTPLTGLEPVGAESAEFEIENTWFSAITEMVGPIAWRTWVAKAAGAWAMARDGLARLPAVPTGVWLAGAIGCALVTAVRVGLNGRNMRHTYPAPGAVRRMVAESADAVGLRRVPGVLMIRDRVSPMVWCGWGARLILPETLWEELDEVGRRAVLCHELAHIRRRDHWVNWLQWAVAAVCWWNPVVWWVRRQLNEEAELCCDAWVTWLLPNHRRTYAEALLRTKEYVANHDCSTPVVGIGVTTGRASRFARRLKMVMTERVRPRLSASGMVTALMLAVLGWVTTPALSCPKAKAEKSCKAKAETEARAVSGELTVATPAPPAPPAQPTPFVVAAPGVKGSMRARIAPGAPLAVTIPEADWSVLATPMPPGQLTVAPLAVGSSRMRMSDEQREHLSARLADLEAQIQALSAQIEGIRSGGAAAGVGRYREAIREQRRAEASLLSRTPRATAPRAEGGAKQWRTYQLPKGKLESLSQLMSRSDVPMLVRPQGNGIEVQGTPRQHEIFKGFICLINPDNDRADADSDDDMDAALAYADMEADGTLLDGDSDDEVDVDAADAEDDNDDEAEATPEADEDDGDHDASPSVLKDVARALLEAGVQTMAKNAHEHGVDADSMRRESEALSRQAKAAEREADRLHDRADRMSDEAETLRERATRLSGAEATESQERADELVRRADEIRDRASTLEERAASLEAEADSMLEAADATASPDEDEVR